MKSNETNLTPKSTRKSNESSKKLRENSKGVFSKENLS